MDDNALDFELEKSVEEFFCLIEDEMDTIINQVLVVVRDWKTVAKKIEIFSKEISLMEAAFNTKV